MKRYIICCVVALLFSNPLPAKYAVDAESGVALFQINDVQVPNPAGTRLSLTDDLKTDPKPFIRMNFIYNYSDKHDFVLLIAPLKVSSEGTLDRDVLFNGELFSANIPIKAYYKFNSYRATYRYKLIESAKDTVGFGVTLKIRDASIEFINSVRSSKTENLGFVPLLHFHYKRSIFEKCFLLIDGDALVGPQGRAEDVTIAYGYKFGKGISGRVGYRILEGGADVEKVYNFALVHYFLIGITVDL